MKTLDAEGNFHTRFATGACEPLDPAAVDARVASARLAAREALVASIPDARMAVQVWVGSRREFDEAPSAAATEAERDARVQALPAGLRRLLQPVAGSFAYVGLVTHEEALALARHDAVRLFHAYPALAQPAADHVARAYALPESEGAERGGMAVFDECATEASGVRSSSFADASGTSCLVSSHGTRVARLAFDEGSSQVTRSTAGLTATTTDAPESLAAPALWALARRHAGVMVQTLHLITSESANDALDTLIAEAAYPDALVVRAAGNGVATDPVVHRVLGALDVGAHGIDAAPLPSARAGNPLTAFADVERPALLDDGVVVDEEGGTEGTSFAAPRTARAALAIPPSRAKGYTALVRRAQILAASRSLAADPGEALRSHDDGALGAGTRGAVAVNTTSEVEGVVEALAVNLPPGARAVRELRVPFAAGSPVRGTFALVFEGAPHAARMDPSQSEVDLDLRVQSLAGVTLAASQSFEDDQEVTTASLRGGETVRLVIEQASATPARRAVLVWRFRKSER